MKFGRQTTVAATTEQEPEDVTLFHMLSDNKAKSTTKVEPNKPPKGGKGGSTKPWGFLSFQPQKRGHNGDSNDGLIDTKVDEKAVAQEADKEAKKSVSASMFKRKNKDKNDNSEVQESRDQVDQKSKDSRGSLFHRNKPNQGNSIVDDTREASETKGTVKLFKRKGGRGGSKCGEDASAVSVGTCGTKRSFIFKRGSDGTKGASESEGREAPAADIAGKAGPGFSVASLAGSGAVDSDDDKRVQLRAVVKSFGPDANKLVHVEKDEDPPTLESQNHVLIKVQASTVTLNDCLARKGFDSSLLSPISLPLTPGMDCIGTVSKIGDRVTEFATGDRVAALVRTGGNARYISVPETSLVKIANSLDSGEAAAIVSIYATAYQCLKAIAPKGGPMYSLQDKKVLVLGGMDGVDRALIQMCRKAKAEIYFCAPTHRHLYVKNIMGVNPLPENDWLPEIEGQLDFVFDGICKDGSKVAYKALKPDGDLVCYGQSALLQEKEMGMLGPPMATHWNNMCNAMSPRVHLVDVWDQFRRDPKAFKDDLKTLFQHLKHNKMSPHIAKRVALTGVGEAQAKLESGEMRGAIVCFPWRSMRSAKIDHQSSTTEEK